MKFNEQEVIELLKANEKPEQWVLDAREKHGELKALVNGDGFSDFLIDKIEGLEAPARAIARKKYAKDIRDLFFRVFKKRDNVFEANGGSETIKIENETILKEFLRISSSFKSNKSIFKYLSEYYFNFVDTDPNGLIMLEYTTEPLLKVYPTYKSINDVRKYEPNGQLCEYLIFEPIKREENKNVIWRVVDDVTDWTVIENGGNYIVNYEKTFEHPFGKVPALILSDVEKVGTYQRLSPVTPVEELAKDYARDKSILTIYKFQNGFPIQWRYISQCKPCLGTGKTGTKGDTCAACDGKGFLSKSDVTDMVTLNMPKNNDTPVIAPNIAGFISPDLKTWEQYQTDLLRAENKIDDTIWGTDKTQEKQNSDSETATGRFIDVQPMTNTLNGYTDAVEYIHNTIANWVLNFVDPIKKREEKLFSINYGRRYILESPDVILEKYQTAKTKGDNNTILDKLLEEFILSKHKADPAMQEKMMKKFEVEPYPHNTLAEINTNYGPAEGLKKILFQKFWETADTDKTAEQLTIEFKTYFTNESSETLQAVKETQQRREKGALGH